MSNQVYISNMETPLGSMVAGSAEDGICLLEFTDRRMLKTEFKLTEKAFHAEITEGDNSFLKLLRRELDDYFNKRLKRFSVPLSIRGTPFQMQVWDELLKIPYGTTRSYKQQAIAVKKPDAVRAVANANGMNRIAIIIPCHRIIGEDGSMTGYGGGIWRKKWLLDLETGQQTLTH